MLGGRNHVCLGSSYGLVRATSSYEETQKPHDRQGAGRGGRSGQEREGTTERRGVGAPGRRPGDGRREGRSRIRSALRAHAGWGLRSCGGTTRSWGQNGRRVRALVAAPAAQSPSASRRMRDSCRRARTRRHGSRVTPSCRSCSAQPVHSVTSVRAVGASRSARPPTARRGRGIPLNSRAARGVVSLFSVRVRRARHRRRRARPDGTWRLMLEPARSANRCLVEAPAASLAVR